MPKDKKDRIINMISSILTIDDDDVSSITSVDSAETRNPKIDPLKQVSVDLAKADARHSMIESNRQEAEYLLTEAEDNAAKAFDEVQAASDAMQQYQRHGMWWQRSEEEKAARAQLKQLRKKSIADFRLQHDALARVHVLIKKESAARDEIKVLQKTFMAVWKQKCADYDAFHFDYVPSVPEVVGIPIAWYKPRLR